MRKRISIFGPAGAILAVYLLLALLYSALAPVFESSDEPNHFPYVAHIAAGLGLPVQQPGIDSPWQKMWRQEASQPPLYYLLAAALVRPVDLSDLPQVNTKNPHARIGDPNSLGNKNMMLHSDREAFPWRGTVLAVHLARLFSVLLGAGTVCCTHLLARRLAPGRPAVALGAMAANAFLPMFIFISASVNNDNLVVFLASLTLLLLVQLAADPRGGRPSVRTLMLPGVIIGLAALTKLTGLALIPLAGLALLLRQDFSSGWRRWLPGFMRDYALLLLPILIIAGWWYVRNWQLYGDPTGLSAMLDAAGRRSPRPTLADLAGEFQGFRVNFWGLFGAVNVLQRPTWVYQLLDVLSLTAGVGLTAAAIRLAAVVRKTGPAALTGKPWQGWLLAATWIVVVFASLVRWTSITMASQGRLMFPTISALAFFFVAGLAAFGRTAGQIFGERPARVLARAGAYLLPAALLPLAVLAPWVSILPAYAPPPTITARDIPASALALDVTYGDVIRLLAIERPQEPVHPGAGLTVTLYWEAIQPSDRDYSFYIQLLGRDRTRLGQVDSYPGGGALPTSHLIPGQIVRDRYHIPIDALPEDGPVLAGLEVGLYDYTTGSRLPARTAAGESAGNQVARVKVLGQAVIPAEQTFEPLHTDFAGLAALTGYATSSAEIRPGDTFTVTLLWDVRAPLDADYTVFLHLRDAQGQNVAQGDGPPAGGAYPTTAWAAGETLLDPHPIRLPANLPPGQYTLVAGLYAPESGRRLPRVGSAETESRLGAVDVRP